MSELNVIAEEIKSKIATADKVLIGIGKELESKISCEDNQLTGYYFLNPLEDDGAMEIYRKMYELVKDKDYQIISLSMDDRIYKYFPEDRVVTPCGNTKKLQCNTNCNDKLYDIGDEAKAVCNKILKKEKVLENDFPRCPDCGNRLVVNNILASSYNEQGYIDRFAEYKKWLQSTINRNLIMLELGVGMRYPSVIRLPFDKMCYYNQKCSFYRVHDTLYQHTAENKERGISVKATVRELFEYL